MTLKVYSWLYKLLSRKESPSMELPRTSTFLTKLWGSMFSSRIWRLGVECGLSCPRWRRTTLPMDLSTSQSVGYPRVAEGWRKWCPPSWKVWGALILLRTMSLVMTGWKGKWLSTINFLYLLSESKGLRQETELSLQEESLKSWLSQDLRPWQVLWWMTSSTCGEVWWGSTTSKIIPTECSTVMRLAWTPTQSMTRSMWGKVLRMPIWRHQAVERRCFQSSFVSLPLAPTSHPSLYTSPRTCMTLGQRGVPQMLGIS